MENKNFQFLDRRLFCLALTQGAAFGFLSYRLYYLQIKKGKEYAQLAHQRRIRTRLLHTIRGNLWDRQGEKLAFQTNGFQAVYMLNAHQLYHRQTFEPIVKAFQLTEKDVEVFEKKLEKYGEALIKSDLTWKEVEWIENHKMIYPFVSVETQSLRRYSAGVSVSHVLGYVRLIRSAREEMYKGFSGLEKQYDAVLQGKNGEEKLEMNAQGQVMQVLSHQPPLWGKDVRLSLHKKLQEFIYHRLKSHRSAVVVVIKIDTGEIMAMVSYPGFDANAMSHGVSQKEWAQWMNSLYTPMVNKATSGLYAPGSVMKIATALSALELGVIHEATRTFCEGRYWAGKHTFHCWKKGGHGSLNVVSALQQSCDTFFYGLAKKIGIEKLNKSFSRLGLGQNLLPQFPSFKPGILPGPPWKLRRFKKPWTLGDTVMTTIGQGFLTTTPLHLAVLAARIARGKEVIPTFLFQKDPVHFPRLDFLPKHLSMIREGLFKAVNSPGGTAFSYRILKPFLMAGKTSTSQVRSISKEDRKAGRTSSLHFPWHQRDHSLFCGYAPYDYPLYSISVLLEHGVKGAPKIAQDVFLFMESLKLFD